MASIGEYHRDRPKKMEHSKHNMLLGPLDMLNKHCSVLMNEWQTKGFERLELHFCSQDWTTALCSCCCCLDLNFEGRLNSNSRM